MRKAERLDELYDTYKYYHKKYFRDWRFGQLVSNFMGWCVSTGRCHDIFFPEDDKWTQWIKDFAKENSPYYKDEY